MATLHIEHAISDLPTWLRAFSHFEAARRRAGVRAERVLQPIDDDKYRLRLRSPALRGRAS